MKVAFVKPATDGLLGLEMIAFVEPLGLECVAATLEADGHDCRIWDLRIDGTERGVAEMKAFEPDVVGIQCNFTTERFRTVALARRVKEVLPDAFVLTGGHDVSRHPEWYLDPAVDAAAIGDGEAMIGALADALEGKGDLKKVPSLVFVNGGGVVQTAAAPRMEADELPIPARHLIRRYAGDYYFNFHKPLAIVESARGCPFKCNFCSVWKFHESTFREKSVERVVEELRQIETRHVFFSDDIFWMNVKRAKELARQIKAAGIRKWFKIQTRSDIICRHPELIEMWKECGKLSIFLGLEKIDDAGLKAVNKKNKAEHNDRAIEICREMDVGYTPGFIADPDWDREDFARLREWVSRTGAYNSSFTVLTPLPGTDLWDEARNNLTTLDWELYDLVHSVLPTKLPAAEFYKEYAGLWRHAMNVRFRDRGRLRIWAEMTLAVLTGKLTPAVLRRGMNMSRRFSQPATFESGHAESAGRLQEMEARGIGAGPEAEARAA